MTLGRVLIAVALHAHKQISLSGKGPFHQRAAAHATQETVTVPVAVPVGEVLKGHSDGDRRV